MKKYEKLREKYNEAVTRKKTMTAEIESLGAEAVKLAEEADEAAQAGNISLYREKRDAAQLAKDTAHVRRKQLEVFSELQPVSEGAEAWKEYAGEYAKNFEKARNTFEEAQKAFAQAYLALVEVQADGLNVRAQISESTGTNCCNEGDMLLLPKSFDGNAPDLILAGVRNPYMNKLKTPEMTYLLKRKLLTERQASHITSVVYHRRPV